MAVDAPETASPRRVVAREPARIALVGNPNTGKTTLFNRLCGARAKTSNFPGTTTTSRVGRAALPGEWLADIIDLPGLYELALDMPETRIARDVLSGSGLYRQPDAVLVVIDACNLTRNLVLVGELLAYRLPVVVALNMIDLAQGRGLTIDARKLSERLGCPVIPMIARRGDGVDEVRTELARALAQPHAYHPAEAGVPAGGATIEALTLWADDVMSYSAGRPSSPHARDAFTEGLDRVFTHPVFGLVVFVVVMGGLFYTLFALATIPMDLIEATFARLGDFASGLLPDGPVRDLVSQGIIGGVAGTVVFLPQICLLFFLISLLEDTGYLARAAFVMDRVLRRFGLPGHAFVPLLTSSACALPGIMSTRLIPDRRDRLATILVAPLMSCSARLPVYVLLTSLLFPRHPLYAAAAFTACYLLGALAALGTAMVFGRTWLRGKARPMVLELPTYKWPSLANAVITAKDQGLSFLQTAGTVIMAICILMWWLSAYPHTPAPERATALRAQAERTTDATRQQALVEEATQLEARAQQRGSIAGRMGRLAQPVFAPLGFDAQLTVGILTSFLAREVFVSTMSVLVGGSGEADVDAGVIERIRGAARDDGTPLFTTATSASALVFFVLAMQCLPTLTVTRRETGSGRYAVLQFAYMSTLAYVTSLIVYQALRAGGIA
ncbi:ferrous iron transporter B [Luteitalea sp. TBR-22]|uniref:ferrous iron transporter B n=1 Tax=Luteitalea sp. TBR-22 TaxID=2802971 RepID=UPI001AF0D6EA|nr:ferrous iron transporter B [Luteitalea sp. TBR-22]BCS31576.1 ferrous iron transporter B [Luteitalea sp. TBR-22]